MKAVVAAVNQEKALVGDFSVIVQLHRWIDLRHYSLALIRCVQQTCDYTLSSHGSTVTTRRGKIWLIHIWGLWSDNWTLKLFVKIYDLWIWSSYLNAMLWFWYVHKYTWIDSNCSWFWWGYNQSSVLLLGLWLQTSLPLTASSMRAQNSTKL